MNENIKKLILTLEAKNIDDKKKILSDFNDLKNDIETKLSNNDIQKQLIDKIETVRGNDGTDGKDGIDGQQGEKGDKGDKGDRGDTGEKGDKGDKGDRGEKGENGKDGIDGLDGLDGNEITQEELVNKINTIDAKIDWKVLKDFKSLVNQDTLTKAVQTLENQTRFLIQSNSGSSSTVVSGGSSWTVVSSDITAENDGQYTLVASAVISDPTPAEGKGYWVVVRNGTLDLEDGNQFSGDGTLVYRIYHSGTWTNYSQSPYNDATSSIQTQLNSKLSVGTGTVTVTTNSQTVKYLNPVFGGITGGNVAISANNVYMTPFLVQDDLTILGLAHNVSGTSTLSMGIYSGNIGELGTINLVTNSGLSVATSGTFATYNVTYGTPITLTPGLYWLAFATTAIVNIQTIPNGTAWNPLLATSDALSGYQYMFRASVAGSGTTMPSSIATSVNWTAQSRSNAPMNCKAILA